MIKNFFNKILQYYYATNKREVLFQSKLRQEIESIKKKNLKEIKKILHLMVLKFIHNQMKMAL